MWRTVSSRNRSSENRSIKPRAAFVAPYKNTHSLTVAPHWGPLLSLRRDRKGVRCFTSRDRKERVRPSRNSLYYGCFGGSTISLGPPSSP
jgi:hypothetical protein